MGEILIFIMLVIQCIFIVLAFRFVGAHEKMANAMKKQSDALDLFMRKQAKKKDEK